jgi:beta-glucosidase
MAGSETKINLPPGFLFGAASAAHQVEGDNVHNNWWRLEQQGRLPKSGRAADHYHRYVEDFQLAHEIGLNLMRISIEWSRIEPEEGQIVQAEVEHYRQVLLTMKAQGLTRMVTLFHWTMPQWFYEQGGFNSSTAAEKFARFSKLMAEQLGSEIDYWITLNEPDVYSYMSYRAGLHPPFYKSTLWMIKILRQLVKAHKASYQAIKKVSPQAQIGLAKNNIYFEAFRPKSLSDQLTVAISNYFTNYYFLDRTKNFCDFIGLNYYFYHTLQFHLLRGWQVKNLAGPKSDMGWRTFPQGIYYLVKDLHRRYHKPIFITENGIANAHDDMRARFIAEHLQALSQAIAEGADVRGYCYWSLTDTYEWHDGFKPKFGLIEVDFTTMQRTVRPSSKIFKQIYV